MENRKKKLFWVAIVAIVAFGIFLRFYGVTQESFWIDEGYSIAISQAIADHGYPLLDSGSTSWRSPLFHYPLATLVALFGPSELATRGFSILLGLASIGLLGYIATRWFSIRTGFFMVILMSIGYWEIAWSRQARMYMMLQFVFWLAMLLFERFLYTDARKKYIIPLLLLIPVLYLTHQFGVFIVVAYVLGYLIYRALQKSWKPVLFLLSYIVGLLLMLTLVLIAIALTSLFPVPVQYWDHYTHFVGAEYTVLLFLAVIGILFAIKQNKRFVVLWLVAVLFTGVGVLSYGIALLQYRYLFFLMPGVLLLAAYALDRLSRMKWFIGAPLILIAFGVALWNQEIVLFPQVHYPLESDSRGSQLVYKSFTPQPDFQTAYQFIEERNPEILLTPYPMITRLYLDREDDQIIYIDLSGTGRAESYTHEVYTGLPFITQDMMESYIQNGQNGLILLDFFAEKRMDSLLLAYIQEHSTVLVSIDRSPWSTARLYEF